MKRFLCGGAMLSALLVGATACSDDAEPAVVPYRPTASNPADLPVPGWLEAEFGGLRVLGEDRSRADSVPWLLKYAFDEDHGLLVGGNAYATQQAPGMPGDYGVGDTSVEYKQRFAIDDATAFGIEAGAILPTAPDTLGVGKTVWLVNGIVSRDLGTLHVDVNLGLAHYAQHDTGVSAWQQNAAAAISLPLGSKFGAALEVSGAHQAGAPSVSQVLGALNYNLSPRVVLDAGAARGLTHRAHDRSVFAGATVLLGRLR